MAPTSRLENPSTRVYSSPKPTQPDSSTIGEASSSPQKRVASEAGGAAGEWRGGDGAAIMRANYRLNSRHVSGDPVPAGDSAQHRQYHPAVRQHRLRACTWSSRWASASSSANCAAPGSTTPNWRTCACTATWPPASRRWAAHGSTRSRPAARAATARRRSSAAMRCCSVRDARPAHGGARGHRAGEQAFSIPMRPGNRSLNLSNAVAVVVYEAWRPARASAAGRANRTPGVIGRSIRPRTTWSARMPSYSTP